MAYLGSTQLSSISNPPVLMFSGIGGGADTRITDGSTVLYISNNFGFGLTTGSPTPGRGFGQQIWLYHSTEMTSSLFDGSSAYFTDGGQLGMRPGDVVFSVSQDTTDGKIQYLRINTVNDISTSGGAMTSTKGLITSAT